MNRTSLSLALTLIGASSASAQVTFTVIGPGRAADVSSDGTYVVGTDASGAFLWGPGGTTSLGQDDAVSVSDDGTVVFGNITDPGGLSFAGRWTQAAGWVAVGDLGGQSGNSVSTGYGMSDDGTVGTGLAWINAGSAAAFRDEPAGSFALVNMGSGSFRGNAVSGDGTLIGGWDEAMNGSRLASLWDANSVQSLFLVDPAVNPDGAGEVSAISTDGTWVCGFASPIGGRRQGFIWSQATGATYLGEGPPTGSFFDGGFANGISDDGTVAVGQWGAAPFNFTGTIWTAANGLELFDDYLAANNVASAVGWNVSAVTAITPDGRTVIGNATQGGGFQTSWFIATLDGNVGTNYCSPIANSTGSTGAMSANGSAAVADNDMTLIASSLPAGQFGIFITGFMTDSIPTADGILCIGGPTGRFNQPGQVLQVDASGSFSLGIDLTAIPTPSQFVPVQPGDTLYFQAWHRDGIPPNSGANFTDGVQVDFQ